MWELQWNRRSESSGGNKECEIGLLTERAQPNNYLRSSSKSELVLKRTKEAVQAKKSIR